jgi:hypothetical protein
MMNEHEVKSERRTALNTKIVSGRSLHPAWVAFINYCQELEHGEIEILKIQNGIPVLAEVTRKKVKFE